MIEIVYCPFPEGAHNKIYGCTRCSNGDYQILIDSLQPEERQQHTLRHEYGHILCGHFATAEPEYGTPEYDAREAAADEYAENMTDAEFKILLSLSKIRFPEVVSA